LAGPEDKIGDFLLKSKGGRLEELESGFGDRIIRIGEV